MYGEAATKVGRRAAKIPSVAVRFPDAGSGLVRPACVIGNATDDSPAERPPCEPPRRAWASSWLGGLSETALKPQSALGGLFFLSSAQVNAGRPQSGGGTFFSSTGGNGHRPARVDEGHTRCPPDASAALGVANRRGACRQNDDRRKRRTGANKKKEKKKKNLTTKPTLTNPSQKTTKIPPPPPPQRPWTRQCRPDGPAVNARFAGEIRNMWGVFA